MAQLTVLQSLGRGGVKRGEVESVRVAADWQGRGVGTALLQWVCDEARRRGCVLAQLTSDKRRVDAIRFYEAGEVPPPTRAQADLRLTPRRGAQSRSSQRSSGSVPASATASGSGTAARASAAASAASW
ncbi:MAG: GNAT family N-acetyltransferase [Chloroflexota bacterium]